MEIGYNISIHNLNIYDHKIVQIFSDVSFLNKNIQINPNIKKIYIHSDYKFSLDNINSFYNIKNDVNLGQKITNVYGIIIHFPKRHINNNNRLNQIIKNISVLINKYLLNTNYKLILETDNNINHIGSNITDLEYIKNNIDIGLKKYIMFCIDTSHIFLSGYPVNNFKDMVDYFIEFEIKIGLENIALIHLNDIDSQILGNHSKHLAVKEGVIFDDKNLDFILNLAHTYKIDIILERNKNIELSINNNEVKMLKEVKLKNIKEYILYIIILKYFEFKIDILKTLNEKLKLDLLYTEYKTLKYVNNKTVIDYLNGSDIEKLINKNYNPFKNIPEKYVFVKNINSLLYFNTNLCLKIYDNYAQNIDDLKKLPLKTKRKFLTENQIQSLKYINKDKISIKTADKIVEVLKKINIYYEIYILGSYYRYKRDVVINESNPNRPPIDNYFISDLDILVVSVSDPNNIIEEFRSYFEIKHIFIDGELKKKILCKYKQIYFYIDLFFCTEEEKLTYILFLKTSKKENIILRKVAKNKGYKLNQKGLFKNDERIILNNIQELYAILNITYKEKDLI